jgi:hypothetical protein
LTPHLIASVSSRIDLVLAVAGLNRATASWNAEQR